MLKLREIKYNTEHRQAQNRLWRVLMLFRQQHETISKSTITWMTLTTRILCNVTASMDAAPAFLTMSTIVPTYNTCTRVNTLVLHISCGPQFNTCPTRTAAVVLHCGAFTPSATRLDPNEHLNTSWRLRNSPTVNPL